MEQQEQQEQEDQPAGTISHYHYLYHLLTS
jgi:hypothetical protein